LTDPKFDRSTGASTTTSGVLAKFGIEAQHPDDFLLNQLDLNAISALKSIKAMRGRLRNPPVAAADLAAMLENLQLPLTAARVQAVAELI
jgi:hypothetical protein